MNNVQRTLSVSEVTLQIKELLEGTFPFVWISGEISNFIHHRSGHMYFTLKDNNAELRSVMFRGNNQFVHFKPEDGMQVLAQGKISVYRQRGQYQLIVQRMEPAGIGTLYLAFEALKKQLSAEGIFDPDLKRPIPSYPKTVGIVTSSTGAAIRDIIQILRRRAPYVKIVVRPTLVQGDEAADDIVQALADFTSYGEADVLILGRGGGSLEDLWPFNEEKVARAIHACSIPIISAVGHETDITISDLVADLRTPTPSAAAEMVAPSQAELFVKLERSLENMTTIIRNRLEQTWQHLDHLAGRAAFQQPGKQLARYGEILDQYQHQLVRSIRFGIKIQRSRVAGVWETLEALNPQNILQRGYSIALTVPDQEVIRSAAALKVGDIFELQTAKGKFSAQKTGEVN